MGSSNLINYLTSICYIYIYKTNACQIINYIYIYMWIPLAPLEPTTWAIWVPGVYA